VYVEYLVTNLAGDKLRLILAWRTHHFNCYKSMAMLNSCRLFKCCSSFQSKSTSEVEFDVKMCLQGLCEHSRFLYLLLWGAFKSLKVLL